MGKLLSFPGREAVAAPGAIAPAETIDHSPGAGAEPGVGRLTVRSVVKSFKKRTVVRGVSLDVLRGEAVGLLGPNGAGKTTVFYMITGLIPADEGSIKIDGRDVTKLPMYRRARLGIGYLPQEASIFRGLTVEQNILAVLETVEPNKKRTPRPARRAARGVSHHALADLAGHAAVGRRAPPRRDCPRARHAPVLHAARRAVRRHRSDRG